MVMTAPAETGIVRQQKAGERRNFFRFAKALNAEWLLADTPIHIHDAARNFVRAWFSTPGYSEQYAALLTPTILPSGYLN